MSEPPRIDTVVESLPYVPDYDWILKAAGKDQNKLAEASVLFALSACGATQIQDGGGIEYMLTFLGLTRSIQDYVEYVQQQRCNA